MRALLCLALLAGCGSSKGVAVDLTVKPNCVDDNQAVDHLQLVVNVDGAMVTNNSFTLQGSTFFANVGTSNRVVLILPDSTTHADVTVSAYDSNSKPIGFGEVAFAITGPNIYNQTLDLGNAMCPVMLPSGDGGTGSPVTFVASSDVPPAASVSSVTLNAPAGLMANDVMLASVLVYSQAANVAVTPPDGTWTRIGMIPPQGTTSFVFSKIAGGGEPASYRFTLPFTVGAAGVIAAYRGVDPAQAIGNSAAQGINATTNGSGTMSYVVPSVSTSVAQSRVVVLVGHQYSGTTPPTWTPPSGMTKREDIGDMTIFDGAVSDAGLFMPGIATTTSDTQRYATFTVVALQPQ